MEKQEVLRSSATYAFLQEESPVFQNLANPILSAENLHGIGQPERGRSVM
jgi:hypothetical protein